MANTTDKLAALLQRQSRIEARIEQIQTQQQKQARKDDTRLKILIGAAMLADAQHHPETAKFVKAVLARGITVPRDQAFLAEKDWL